MLKKLVDSKPGARPQAQEEEAEDPMVSLDPAGVMSPPLPRLTN